MKPTQDKKPRNGFKLIVLIIAIMFIATTASLAYYFIGIDNINYYFNNLKQYISTIAKQEISQANNLTKFNSNTHAVFCQLENKLLKIDNEGIESFTLQGNSEKISTIPFTKPIYSCSGKYLAVADSEKSDIYVYENDTQILKEELDGEITGVSINSSGYLAVIFKQKGYNACVKISKPDGQEMFTQNYASSYVTGVAISNKNDFIAVAKCDTSGISIQSGVDLIGIDGSKIAEIPEDSNIISRLRFINKTDFVGIEDDKIVLFSKDGTKKDVESFDEDKVYSINAEQDKYIVKAIKGSKGIIASDTEIQINDYSGKEKGTYYASGMVKGLETYHNNIAINMGSQAIFITSSGRHIKNYKPSSEIKKIILVKNGREAVILFRDSFVTIKI